MPQDFTTGQVLTAAQMDTLSGAVDGYATTATAAGTTTLTTASMYQQFFTGSTTQTVTMPVASTLYTGQKFRVVNNSSGVVTVQSSGANTIYAVPAGGDVIFTCILASGTTAASWDYKNATLAGGGGKVLQVVNARFVTSASNSTSTYAATGIALSITPSLATSKVLILASINVYKSDTAGATQNSVALRLLRDSTTIDQIAELAQYDSNAKPGYGVQSVCYLDSPASTSSISYNFTFANVTGNVSNVKVNADGQMSSTVTLLEIGA
jgi:hypothetical protein